MSTKTETMVRLPASIISPLEVAARELIQTKGYPLSPEDMKCSFAAKQGVLGVFWMCWAQSLDTRALRRLIDAHYSTFLPPADIQMACHKLVQAGVLRASKNAGWELAL